jgi:hypothetical protein
MNRPLVSCLVVLCCVACAPTVATRIPEGVSLPNYAREVTPPQLGVPKAHADFSGIWVGYYEGSARGAALSVVEVKTSGQVLAWWSTGQFPGAESYVGRHAGTFEGDTLVLHGWYDGRPWELRATRRPGDWLSITTTAGSRLTLTRFRPDGR